jgi:hypothetical protein
MIEVLRQSDKHACARYRIRQRGTIEFARTRIVLWIDNGDVRRLVAQLFLGDQHIGQKRRGFIMLDEPAAGLTLHTLAPRGHLKSRDASATRYQLARVCVQCRAGMYAHCTTV